MNGQQEYQLKKEEQQQKKENEHKLIQRKRKVKTIKIFLIIIIIIGAVGYGIYLLSQSAVPKSEDFSRAVPLVEVEHISVGSELPEYSSNPPTSGPHYEQTARSGFRDKEIPDQNIIHNLEHGDVWIAYSPNISEAVKEELKQFSAAKVIISPREANDTDIALASWGRLDTFDITDDSLPEQRIKDFIKRYLNKGPERVSGASGGI